MVATALALDNGHGGDILLETTAADAPQVISPSVESVSALLSTCPLINSQPTVRAVDADNLFQLHQQFVSSPLPSRSMFPWLHGVDGTSAAQNYFFGIDHQLYTGTFLDNDGLGAVDSGGAPIAPKLLLPEHRGLMFIHASDLDPGRLVGSVGPSEILQPAPRLATSLGSQSSFISHGNTPKVYSHNSIQQDINNHPQFHHQHSSVPSALQQQHHDGQGGAERDPDWADIMDDSTISSLSSSSLSSTTSSPLTNNNNTANQTLPPSATDNNRSTSTISTSYLGSFLHSLSDGINIRNFKIQVPRYALLSDIVVYSKDGEQDMILLQLAKQISTAQDEVWRGMKEQYPQLTLEFRRQTFVLIDSFAAFETKYPEMVAVSSTGKASKNKVDFWEQEREQMALLTRASEIAPGVWLGNNTDVPLVNSGASSLATPVSPGSSYLSYFASIPLPLSQDSTVPANKSSAIPSTPPPDENEYPPLMPPSFTDHSTFQPSICVECRSGANAPTTMTLERIKNNVAAAPAPLPPKEIFHLECLGTLAAGVSTDAFPPSASSLSSFARSEILDIPSNHAKRRATAAGLIRGQQLSSSMLQIQTTHLLNMAFFIHSVTNPDASAVTSSSNNGFARQHQQQQLQQPQSHQVLIHCVDGYTESAILALCIVMIHYRLSLAEAFVKLQTDLSRSFFVYPNDSIMMLEVENQVWRRILLEKTEREAGAKWKGTAPSSVVPALDSAVPGSSAIRFGSRSSSTSSGMSSLASSLSSSSSFFSSLLNMSDQSSPLQQQSASASTAMMMEGIEPMPDRDQELEIQRPFAKPGHEERFEWFYHPEFEGSFPSRILPFLYLGNLAHASNPGLLRSLGIKYVLSVGEEAHGLNEDTNNMPSALAQIEGERGIADGTAEMESQEWSKEQGEKTVSKRFVVKLVDDMFDNGVDSLWRHLENCVAFVDEARRANARILIHCRVGVSRSATIVIAYLMAHYNLSLVNAYLMVRARRLSVIIQPNLLFMYELLQWEQQLRGRFDPMGWPGIAREVHSLNMYYIGN